MGVLNIRKAKRSGARLVVGIAGISGSGKTRTALEIAYGLANFDAAKIGFLDTENRRGSLFADVLKNDKGVVQEFWIGDLEPPFTPQRYSDAILEMQKIGIEVLVIDSVSHEYEGTGGVLEMREPLPGKAGKRDNIAKAEHKKFMNTLLQSNMHVIACIRAREKVKIERKGGEVVYEPLGVLPICEKNFMFEMTASLMMWNAGQEQESMKMPEELAAILGRSKGYMTSADGKALRDWVDGGAQVDPEIERTRAMLKTTCEQGMDALAAAWKKLTPKMRAALGENGGCPDSLKRSAQEYDALKKPTANDNEAGLDDLNKQVMGGQPAA